KGRELAEKMDAKLTGVLLGGGIDDFAETLAGWAEKVLVVDDDRLTNFNAEAYQRILSVLIKEHKPPLTLIGHTSFGVDLAPALAVELGMPLATDCMDLKFEDGKLTLTRQMYGGKVNVDVTLREAEGCIATVRPAAFEADEVEPLGGEVVEVESPLEGGVEVKRFIGYVEPPLGEVDIGEADIIVSMGRGIRDEKNLPMIKELAEALRGEVGCSRPVVDKGWLPKDRQVGSSGKTVKPKLYVAVGISGAFQHVLGMKGSGSIIAINKDRKAPIFGFSDYGIVGDLFKVVPALTKKIDELKGAGK
ncbi:MAG: electron transfer flavoprotein subunit alpha/FixB family protein, partial [Candidatus Bathyarchaeota archaeon]|nr:electron transfer flavoprotein subunit alpha/FixB family protein [Candidatus Bathyarchaeota archaeon]